MKNQTAIILTQQHLIATFQEITTCANEHERGKKTGEHEEGENRGT